VDRSHWAALEVWKYKKDNGQEIEPLADWHDPIPDAQSADELLKLGHLVRALVKNPQSEF
jgi:hypothetical protein